MVRRAASVLVALLAQVPLIGVGMRQVSGHRVVHDSLPDFAKRGDHAVDDEQDEQQAQG